VDFFGDNSHQFKNKSNKNLANYWYLDSSTTKHVLGNKSSFKGLENLEKIQNVKFARGPTHGVYRKGK
jgi:hypothetical protein